MENFYGASPITFDPKGRFSVPTKLRESLASVCQGQFNITKHQDRCLMIYPRPAWKLVSEGISKWSSDSMQWRRFYLGNMSEVDLDSADRMLIPPNLREFCGVTKDALLVGMGNYFELWALERYMEQEAAMLQSEIAPEVKEFKF